MTTGDYSSSWPDILGSFLLLDECFASKDALIQVALNLIPCKSPLYRVLVLVFQNKSNRCACACGQGIWGTGDVTVLVLNLCDR